MSQSPRGSRMCTLYTTPSAITLIASAYASYLFIHVFEQKIYFVNAGKKVYLLTRIL